MILKIWFGLIGIVILGSLGALLYSFDLLNIGHWVWFLILVCSLAMTAHMYMSEPYRKETKELERNYAYFLKKKDKQIEELQNKSQVLFNTSMKRSEADVELQSLKGKFNKKSDKLVRNNIPDIIIKNGETPKTHIADDAEFKARLKDKLQEEVHEYLESGQTEELADILEVLYALDDKDTIEYLRKRKAEDRGTFSKRIILD